MDALADITAARRALRTYLAHADGTLPADTFNRLEELIDSPSPVDAIVRSAELLYARRDELDDEGRTIVGQLASFAAVNAWHGMADENRGGLIAQAMTRDLGIKVAAGQPKPQPAEDDPAPKPEFAKPVEADAAAPEAPPAQEASPAP